MTERARNFLKRRSIAPADIKYVIREEGKTAVHLVDGRVERTYIPVKDIRDALPVDEFMNPNKGIVVAASQVVSLHDGLYELADGRTFAYRVHNSPKHDVRLLSLGRNLGRIQAAAETNTSPGSAHRFSVLDGMPIPVLILETAPALNEAMIELTLRYCNDAFLEYEGFEREGVIGRPYSEVFGVHSNRWLVAYADVALNGTVRAIDDYDTSRDRHMTIHCYQPAPGLCACVLLAHSDAGRTMIPRDFLVEKIPPVRSEVRGE